MAMIVIVIRLLSVAAFAAPMLLSDSTRGAQPAAAVTRSPTARAPLIANLAAFALFFALLCFFSSSPARPSALVLALAGGAIALVGAVLVLRSRAELGRAWSLLPKADRDTGLVTTGPYRLVRHPIYLGLTLVAAGNAVSFGSAGALLLVALGIVPTFAWRARAEEGELSRAFGETFAVYRRRTKMIVPHLL